MISVPTLILPLGDLLGTIQHHACIGFEPQAQAGGRGLGLGWDRHHHETNQQRHAPTERPGKIKTNSHNKIHLPQEPQRPETTGRDTGWEVTGRAAKV